MCLFVVQKGGNRIEMSHVTIIDGDILESEAQYIAHQCNCKSKNVIGLADAIFNKFHWSDITSKGQDIRKFGSIDKRGDGDDQRYVINMFVQIYPGKINSKSEMEDENSRKKAFLLCLKQITAIEKLESIAFPYGIGCGYAGGDWEFYSKAIEAFSISVPEVKVYIVRKLS